MHGVWLRPSEDAWRVVAVELAELKEVEEAKQAEEVQECFERMSFGVWSSGVEVYRFGRGTQTGRVGEELLRW